MRRLSRDGDETGPYRSAAGPAASTGPIYRPRMASRRSKHWRGNTRGGARRPGPQAAGGRPERSVSGFQEMETGFPGEGGGGKELRRSPGQGVGTAAAGAAHAAEPVGRRREGRAGGSAMQRVNSRWSHGPNITRSRSQPHLHCPRGLHSSDTCVPAPGAPGAAGSWRRRTRTPAACAPPRPARARPPAAAASSLPASAGGPPSSRSARRDPRCPRGEHGVRLGSLGFTSA